MHHTAAFVSADILPIDTMEADIAVLARGGPPVLIAALGELAVTGVPVDDIMTQMIVVEALCASVEEFDHGDADAALAIIAALSPDQAILAHDMLLFARFDGGTGDTARLADASVLALAALTVATDRPAAAIDLLDDEVTRRGASFTARAAVVHGYADTAIFAL